MDTNIIREEIRHTFEALTEQMEIIHDNNGKIPQIEIDLIMENIRDLYAAFKDLDRQNNAFTAALPKAKEMREPLVTVSVKHQEEDGVREFSFKEKISLDTFKPEIEPVVTKEDERIEMPPREEIRMDAIPEEKPFTFNLPAEPVVREMAPPPPAVVIPKVEEEIKPVKPAGDLFSATVSPSISDRYKDEKKSLNDRLQAEQNDRSISSRLSQNQISDIKSVIGINEKFQFINELFGGNMQEYTTGISQLNQFRNFAEASGFIDILKFKYNWDMNADGYRKLMEILRRRYPS